MKKIAFLIVLVIIISAFAGCMNFGTYSYAEAETYTVGGAELASSEVNVIEINWIAGEVAIESYDGEEILISEDYSGELKERDQMRHRVVDDTLDIKFYAPRSKATFSLNASINRKKLTVKVPDSLELVKVKVVLVSAKGNIADIHTDELRINTVSGSQDIRDINTNNLNITTVSGNIDFIGSANDSSINSVSGKVVMDYMEMFDSLDVDSVSGRVVLKMPDNEGFELSRKTVSGRFSSDFALSGSNTSGIYKDGSASIDINTVSGSITLTQKD